jgi:hypothetical protein
VLKSLEPQSEYRIDARTISGSHVEKLDQIDTAIQELLEIKIVECAAEHPNVKFLAVPRRSHGAVMFVVVLALLVLLAWMLEPRPAHAFEVGSSFLSGSRLSHHC